MNNRCDVKVFPDEVLEYNTLLIPLQIVIAFQIKNTYTFYIVHSYHSIKADGVFLCYALKLFSGVLPKNEPAVVMVL